MQSAGTPQGNAHTPPDTAKILRGSALLRQMRDLIRRTRSSSRAEQSYLDPSGPAQLIRDPIAAARGLHREDPAAGLQGPAGVKSPLSRVSGF